MRKLRRYFLFSRVYLPQGFLLLRQHIHVRRNHLHHQSKMTSKRKDPDIPSSLAEAPPAETQSWSSFLKSIANFRGNIGSLTAPSFIISGTSLTEYSAYWVQPAMSKLTLGGTPSVVCTDPGSKDSRTTSLESVEMVPRYTSRTVLVPK